MPSGRILIYEMSWLFFSVCTCVPVICVLCPQGCKIVTSSKRVLLAKGKDQFNPSLDKNNCQIFLKLNGQERFLMRQLHFRLIAS